MAVSYFFSYCSNTILSELCQSFHPEPFFCVVAVGICTACTGAGVATCSSPSIATSSGTSQSVQYYLSGTTCVATCPNGISNSVSGTGTSFLFFIYLNLYSTSMRQSWNLCCLHRLWSRVRCNVLQWTFRSDLVSPNKYISLFKPHLRLPFHSGAVGSTQYYYELVLLIRGSCTTNCAWGPNHSVIVGGSKYLLFFQPMCSLVNVCCDP